jgi:hypothetical protein
MNKIIIGSTAMKHWFPDFKREPKDLDIAIDNSKEDNVIDNSGDNRIEYLYNPIIFNYTEKNQEYLTAEQLLTLKMSHITWNINFKKHMFDIQFLLSKDVSYDKEMYSELYAFWKEYHGRDKKNRRSDLTMNSKEFFNNALSEFDHDYLHTILKEVPTYTKILKDGSEVEPDENKFLKLSYEDKISVIEEEVMVMSYERFRNKHYKVGYNMMLEKFITGHAPLWQIFFIVENFKKLMNPSINHYKLFDSVIGLEKLKRCVN